MRLVTDRFRRQTHVTPKSYLSFLNSYKQVYAERHAHISALAERMNTGLQKLNEASETVQELSKELAVKEKELAVANEKAESVLKEVRCAPEPTYYLVVMYCGPSCGGCSSAATALVNCR